ncbi:MAG TPA: hypothetical protein VNY75_02195 [Rhizomicrobium sp.]|nr:hypothetical protein [Rhizomicrobium sp.]
MKKLSLLFLLCVTPALAQGMDPNMPGMAMPGMPAKKPPPAKKTKPKKPAQPAPAGQQPTPQPAQPQPMPDMSGMTMKPAPAPQAMPDMDMSHDAKPVHNDMAGMNMGAMTVHGLLGGYAMSREASGTSWQPDAAPHSGIHLMADDWMVMLHGRVNGIADWQSGPRGASQVFSSSMVMAMASKDLANGDTLGLKAMLSADPFMGRRGYPLLLASGETADGTTHLVDRQHPHDLLMELAATYSHHLSDSDSLFVYGGYPGEPALGPSAYMHRISALDNPATPIAHHWLDSSHVTFGVVTAGWVHDDLKLEVSQFTGREPDQFRFDFDTARFDSTAARLSWNPGSHWSLQVSSGWLKSPEQLDPNVDERRLTASATYFNRFDVGSVAATLAFGNKHLSTGVDESAALAEAEFKPDGAWTVFARAETIGSDELVPGPAVRGAGEISLGAIHDWQLAEHWKFGLGGLYAFDFAPSSPTASYGSDPHGAMAFVRLVAE